jgi:hypothetical protein
MAPAEEELARAREQGGEDARSVTEQLAPDDPNTPHCVGDRVRICQPESTRVRVDGFARWLRS